MALASLMLALQTVLLLLPAVHTQAPEEAIFIQTSEALHKPAHVTVIPEEALPHPSPTPSTPEEAHAFPQHDPRAVIRDFALHGSRTRAAAVGAVEALAAQAAGVARAVAHIQMVSNAESLELLQQQAQAHQLHDQAVHAAEVQAGLVTEYVDDLGLLTAAKAAAMTRLDLDEAAHVQQQINAVWSYLTGAHSHGARALADSDILADVALGLQVARAQEHENLAESLRLVARAALDIGQQLLDHAHTLQEDADGAVEARHELDMQIARNTSTMAVRQELRRLGAQALEMLSQSEEQLAAARSHFQRLWHAELIQRQHDALGVALAASAAEQQEDLRWRRDVALAADAYPEAHASQAALQQLEVVQAALVHQRQQQQQQQLAGELLAGGSGGEGGATQPEAGKEGEQQQQQQEEEGGGLEGGGRDLAHQQALRQALQDYKAKLAAQRTAAAALSQLELIRQHLGAGEITPGQALTSLLEVQVTLD